MFHIDKYSEALLEVHEREVSLLKAYYEENKEMLENVAHRQKLFHEFLEFEASSVKSGHWSGVLGFT